MPPAAAAPFCNAPLDASALLAFNRSLLGQALGLVAAHDGARAAAYGTLVGPHLRHVIEHGEALLDPIQPALVDYDSRRRDGELARCPALARRRLLALQDRLAAWPVEALHQPVQVLGLAGLAGEWRFAVASTVARELAFLASHTVHHFALLKAHCLQQGIGLPADFGQAAGTVAHRRQAGSAVASTG